MAALAAFFTGGCSPRPKNDELFPVRPLHHTNKGFKNLYGSRRTQDFFDYLKMRFSGKSRFHYPLKPKGKIPMVPPNLSQIHHPGESAQMTWVGHSTFLLQYRGINILTDPVFSERCSPVSFAGPKRYTPPALSLTDLPKIDLVVISHNHYDHLDRSTVNFLGSQPMWAVPLKNKEWFVKEGIGEEQIIELDWWESHTLESFSVMATPAQHFSGRSLTDQSKNLWASWVIQLGDWKIWFGGDTGYNPYQFKEIGQKQGPFDLALIPIGAYDPRFFMKTVHVNPEEAVQIHEDLGSHYSIGMHWGAFILTSEPVDEPPKRLLAALKEKSIAPEKFEVFSIGETKLRL